MKSIAILAVDKLFDNHSIYIYIYILNIETESGHG